MNFEHFKRLLLACATNSYNNNDDDVDDDDDRIGLALWVFGLF